MRPIDRPFHDSAGVADGSTADGPHVEADGSSPAPAGADVAPLRTVVGQAGGRLGGSGTSTGSHLDAESRYSPAPAAPHQHKRGADETKERRT